MAFLGWLVYSSFDKDVAEGVTLVAFTCVVGGIALYAGVRWGLKYRRVSSMFLEEYRQRQRAGKNRSNAAPRS